MSLHAAVDIINLCSFRLFQNSLAFLFFNIECTCRLKHGIKKLFYGAK